LIKTLLVIVILSLVAGVVYAFGFWGRPVPLRFTLTEKADTDQDGFIDTWHFESGHDGKADFVEIDSNHDGRVDRLQFRNPDIVSNSGIDVSGRKKLAVCLDGVPYEVMAQLWDQGLFREFSRPVKVISVFPSVSDVALSEILHAERVPGYENLYFDVQRNQIAGGAISTVSKARIPYLEILDYDEPGIFKGLAYILPIRTYRADLGRFLKRYAASPRGYYKAHLCATDSLCHLMTPNEFAKYLREVDTLLRDIFLQHQGKLDLVVFSDHGNSQVPSRRLDVEHFLAEAGFQVESSLRSQRSVAIPGFGLVGVMAVYCATDNIPRLARLFSRCEGVDFCAFLEQGAVRISSDRGTARILADASGHRLKYERVDGDPLELALICDQLLREAQVDSQGFVQADVWFKSTVEHQFPDAINAIFRGVNNHVTNRASLLVSLKDGYHYGSRFFNQLVTLRSTHGSLRKTSMTGFAMCNGPMSQKIVPARDVLSRPGSLVAQ